MSVRDYGDRGLGRDGGQDVGVVLLWDGDAHDEETFQSLKGLAGLDKHQVRRYPSWTHRVTLAMLAHAFLAVVRADEHAHRPRPDDLIPLTCNEIQHLFITLVVRPFSDAAHRQQSATQT